MNQQSPTFAPSPVPPRPADVRPYNLGRDVCALVLLVVAALLPWNLYLGLGVPGSTTWVFVLLVVATVLALGALLVKLPGSDAPPVVGVVLVAPYLMFVVAVLGFAVVQTIRSGGGLPVPPGVGPGAWLGVAGALLAGQPSLTGSGDDDRLRRWLRATRLLAWTAMALAVVFTLFNQYWRIQHTFAAGESFGMADLMVIVSIIVYGVAGLVMVVVGARWLLETRRASRLAVTALGASTIVGGTLVWVLGAGREIDAFHGIAQSTGTMFVGFEGYLAWAAAAAIVGPLTLLQAARSDRAVWRDAARKLLLFLVIWGSASAVVRVTDLLVAAAVDVRYSSYTSVTLLVFDLIWVGLAVWLRRSLDGRAVNPNVLTAVSAAIFVVAICRIVLGVVLAPRVVYLSGLSAADNPVYGNDLAQQFTGTFDVVVAGVAAAVLAVVLGAGQLGAYLRARSAPAVAAPAMLVDQPTPVTERIAAHATERIAAPATEKIATPAAEPATQQLSSSAPKIFREADGATQQMPSTAETQQMPAEKTTPRIHRALKESSQRFAAGTTYGGPGQKRMPDSGE